MDKFIGKIFIEGEIVLVTGLHIGGSKETGEIGGLDNPVIKTVEGIPYIPGSSLKGKIRSLLERTHDIKPPKEPGEPCGCGECEICQLFGSHSTENKTISRLIIRDSFLDEEDFQQKFGNALEGGYTEEKVENIIDRIKGTAKDPRIMERVPAGARFKFSSAISIYEKDDIQKLLMTFVEGMRMLEDDYLGGSGTRGYGQVRFENLNISIKSIKDYLGNNTKKTIIEGKALSEIKMEDLTNKIEDKLSNK